jgi:hypothetical protein
MKKRRRKKKAKKDEVDDDVIRQAMQEPESTEVSSHRRIGFLCSAALTERWRSLRASGRLRLSRGAELLLGAVECLQSCELAVGHIWFLCRTGANLKKCRLFASISDILSLDLRT